MKALHFLNHGSTENLRYGEVDNPKVLPGTVLIQVRAAALNHLDLWVLKGWPGLKLEKPHIGGSDISGEILEVGAGVMGWRAGDNVVVNPGLITEEDEFTMRGEDSLSPNYQIFGENTRGGFAERIVVPASNLRPKPADWSFAEASGVLLVGLTAWRMLKRRAQLKLGESVLVVGAGGGVNSFSIQLASALGAHVIALTSTMEKAQRAKKLGAHAVINYKENPDWSREIRRMTTNRGVDVVIDNVGRDTFAQSINSACRGGRIVTVGNTSGPLVEFDNRYVFAKQLSILGSTMGSRKDFTEVMEFVEKMNLRPVVDEIIPLSEGRRGYDKLEQGTQFGKIVLDPTR